jgi:hypothetical protein
MGISKYVCTTISGIFLSRVQYEYDTIHTFEDRLLRTTYMRKNAFLPSPHPTPVIK